MVWFVCGAGGVYLAHSVRYDNVLDAMNVAVRVSKLGERRSQHRTEFMHYSLVDKILK